MSNVANNTLPLAEKLLELVKSTSVSNADPLTVWQTKIEIQNTCDLLLARTIGPLEYTILIGESCQESSALHFVTSLGIADLIGSGECSLAELSAKAQVEARFLGVAMSCLLGRGYFEEVGCFGSYIYKNNELSEVLREGHSSTLKSAVGFILVCDEGFKATSYLLDAARVSHAANGDAPKKKLPAVNIAFDFSSTVFDWMSSPGDAWRGKRMGEAMQQLHRMANVHVAEDYPWHELSTPIVDVGGGIGTLEMSILNIERNIHLDFVLFDLPETIENGKKVWRSKPPAVSLHISFVAGNFLAPSFSETNIPQGKPTYIIRHVLHDWTDDEVVRILGTVRQAMQKGKSRLLLVEMLLREDSSRFVRTTSMQLLALNNGITRTQCAMEDLVRKAGFKVAKVTHMRAVDSVIEAVVE